ncbi:MAG: prenyltransferase [Spartobacteria bacterium]|nr:prenyltransferase [Spartobacteria bacterium]
MSIWPYIKIARPDHWFKNIFLFPGICLAVFFDHSVLGPALFWNSCAGFLAACLVASSNYVLNEILDAEQDRCHPVKKNRPMARGDAKKGPAYIEWLTLGALGLGLGFWLNTSFGLWALALWIMGTLYNVRPIRLKEWPYVDVLSEAVNNPIRLAMGWYIAAMVVGPPLSIVIAYWMFGAFLMAAKRLAEYRMIDHPEQAARYRKSFGYYNDERLVESLMFYASLFALMSGVFISRYRVELVLATPLVALCMAYYLHMSYKPDSPAQNPERLLRQPKLMAIVLGTFVACVCLLFIDLPGFADYFNPRILPTVMR